MLRLIFMAILGLSFVSASIFEVQAKEPVSPQKNLSQRSQSASSSAEKRRPTSRPAVSSKESSRSSVGLTKMDRQIEELKAFLSQYLMRVGRDPKNPWLLAHALLVFGKDLKLKNGKLVIDHIVSTYMKISVYKHHIIPYFPDSTRYLRIDPHPYTQLKIFLDIGVPMSRVFKVGMYNITLGQMFKAAIMSLPPKQSELQISDGVWLLLAMYGRLKKPHEWVWTNVDGQQVNFFRLLWRTFFYLDKQTSFLRQLWARGVKKIVKKRQYIYREPCGGFHLLQATLRWMGHPMLKRKLKDLFNAQVELMFYRYVAETRLYVDYFKRYQHNKVYRLIILLQQLKFLGHFLETIALLHEWKQLNPTLDQRKIIRRATRLLMITVMLLNRLGFYANAESLKKTSFQYFLDLSGDSAHALHSLQLLSKSRLYKLTPR